MIIGVYTMSVPYDRTTCRNGSFENRTCGTLHRVKTLLAANSGRAGQRTIGAAILTHLFDWNSSMMSISGLYPCSAPSIRLPSVDHGGRKSEMDAVQCLMVAGTTCWCQDHFVVKSTLLAGENLMERGRPFWQPTVLPTSIASPRSLAEPDPAQQTAAFQLTLVQSHQPPSNAQVRQGLPSTNPRISRPES